MFKFVHAADLHIDSMLRGLEAYPGAPAARIRNASRQALTNLVQLCLDEGAAFLLLAGDLFDDEWKDYGTGLFFFAELSRLRDAGISVFLVYGNHDAACQFTKSLKPPPHVRVFPADRPRTFALEALNVVVHGQSYDRREVTRDLSADYPPPVAGAFNIGLLHTAAEGRTGHEPYAPCTTRGLAGRGYQYWALGHVHRREVLAEEPWIVFPGNLQGRHARETGAKGATLVTVDDASRATIEHRTLDVVRWESLVVDATSAASADDVRALVRARFDEELGRVGERLLVARTTVVGMTRAHDGLVRDRERWEEQLRADATADGAGRLWLEKIRLRSQPQVDREALLANDDPLGGLLRSLRALRGDEAKLASLVAELTVDLRKKLPGELSRGEEPFDLTRPELLRQLLEETESMLLPLLLDSGGDA